MYSKDNFIYIITILESIEKCFIYTEDITNSNDFFGANDQLNFNATQLLLMTIGEESKKLEEKIKTDNPEIDWKNIANFRNRIAHDYRGVNPEISFEIVKNYLPELKEKLIEIFKKTEVSEEVLAIALNSEFYKHIIYLKNI